MSFREGFPDSDCSCTTLLEGRIIFTIAARAAPSTVLSFARSQDVGVEREISLAHLFSSYMDSVVETQRLFRKVQAVLSIQSQQREKEARRNYRWQVTFMLLIIHTSWFGSPCFGEEWQQFWSFGNLAEFSHSFLSSRIAPIDRHHQRKRRNVRWSSLLSALSLEGAKHGLSKCSHITKRGILLSRGIVGGGRVPVLRIVLVLYCQLPSLLRWHQAKITLLNMPKQGLNAKLQAMMREARLSNSHIRWIKS